MSLRYLAWTCLAVFATAADSQSPTFNRFTADLPQLLETDAATVMTRGLTHDFAKKLCARVGGSVAQQVEKEGAAWTARNDAYIRASVMVLSAFGDRLFANGGENARQGYFHSIGRQGASVATQRLMRQFNGANLENSVVPPESACAGLANSLRDGEADFKRTPDVTRALIPYMQRSGKFPEFARGPKEEASDAYDRGDYATALRLFQPLADAGDVDALGNLGNMYGFGRGVERDVRKAHEYWSRAADKHLGTAMFNIAVIYFNGEGGFPKDDALAAQWYKRAAEHRHNGAMITLSSIYATGRGFPVDKRMAIVWASLAASYANTPELKKAPLAQLLTLTQGMPREELEQIQSTINDTAKIVQKNVAEYQAQRAP